MSLAKLKEETLPAIFTKNGSKLLDYEFDSSSVGQDQFMSNVVFLTVLLQTNKGKDKIPLVVKFEPFNLELRNFVKSSIQFYNEVLMYKTVVPFLNKNYICEEIFAKFYHGVGECGGSENIVVLEDLRSSGFTLTEERAFISYEHLVLAMAKLGRFHALSYAAKKDSPEEFYKVIDGLKESSWVDSDINTTLFAIMKSCFHRPAEYLIRQEKHVEILQKLLKVFDRDINEFMKKLVAPEEPWAVVCHGDFCRNNILFKYDIGNGNPIDVKFFDIATSRYSSPVVDISFFLFMNSSKETRQMHWDELLAVYHHSLSTTVPGAEVPSLEAIRKEVLRRALYGFIHCSFFLPMMMFEHSYDNLEIVMNTPEEEVARDYALIGGEEGTKLLADMLEEIIERGVLTLDHDYMKE